MKLRLVKASNQYCDQIKDMLDEWNAAGEKIIPYAIRRVDYHDFAYYCNNLEVKDNSGSLVPDSTFFCLGACPGRNTVENEKARNPFDYADFRHFTKTQNSVDFAFDHSLSHFHAKTRKIEYISGCGAAGSAGGLGPSGRRFDPCHSDQICGFVRIRKPQSRDALRLFIKVKSYPKKVYL